MEKQDIIDYVLHTPSNTNPAVLGGMLDAISGTQLPSPTESDNGKVLGVDGGEYKLVEQSGGAEVSKIKIASLNGGGPAIGDSGATKFSGGGPLLDSKKLGEIVGDKTIVDFAFVDTNTGAAKNRIIGSIVFGGDHYDGVGEYELAKEQTSCAVFAIYSGGNTAVSKIDVYAICI